MGRFVGNPINPRGYENSPLFQKCMDRRKR